MTAETDVSSTQGCGRTVSHVQLEQHLGDVVAHGLLRDGQASRDLKISAPGGQEVEDFSFARSQVGERSMGPGHVAIASDDSSYPPADGTAVHRISRRNGQHRSDDLLPTGALDQVSMRPGA